MSDSVSWNLFRYGADYLHFGGMCFGLLVIGSKQSVEGFSYKTQLLYQAIYVTRYLDLFVESQIMYLVFFKLTFNIITALMLVCFQRFGNTYDARADSCNVVAIVCPTMLAAFFFSRLPEFVERMWTFSEYLETFALVPQYIVCYKSQKMPAAVIWYVLCLGGYRCLYVMNWLYKRFEWASMYTDYTSWVSGGVECLLFFDFVVRLFKRNPNVLGNDVLAVSALGHFVLNVDNSLGQVSNQFEMNFVGRRIPYGLSGGVDDGFETHTGSGSATEKRGLMTQSDEWGSLT